jgi:two-component system nitrate/nitrite response regulator NarL
MEDATREAPGATRIFLIAETAIYRDALRLLLDAEPDFQVIGVSADCARALDAARDSPADILLLDCSTPILPGADALGMLAGTCASARIIVLVPALDRHEIIEALRRGVRGVVLKAGPTELLFRSIRAVAAGQYWIGRETVADLVQNLSMPPSTEGEPARKNFGLTARELDIVSALVADCVNKEIAKRFAISEKTVKHHLTNIFDKLGVSNRLELVMFALHHQLVIPGQTVPDGVERRPKPSRTSRPA